MNAYLILGNVSDSTQCLSGYNMKDSEYHYSLSQKRLPPISESMENTNLYVINGKMMYGEDMFSLNVHVNRNTGILKKAHTLYKLITYFNNT